MMAASANPSGNQDGSQGTSSLNGGGGHSNGGNYGAAPDNSALKHNPGLAVEWSPEEQTILEEGLSKYAPESNIVRYAKIAMQLHDKTVRDVALRCRWMTKKENGKRRKDDHVRKNKDKKEKGVDPSTKPASHSAVRPNVPPYTVPMPSMDNDDEISYKAIGGPMGQMLEQNSQLFNQITANFASLQLQENISLLAQSRDNLLTLLNDLNDMPEIMKQMPPIPAKMNEELANTILPRTSIPRKP